MTDMRYRQLGTSGLRISLITLGCNYFGSRIDADESKRVVDAALDVGINIFDTANIYSDGNAEEPLGAALRGRRDEVLIATKFGGGGPDGRGGSRRVIMRSVEQSLRKLGTDYIDLYQIHFPDAFTPIEETLRALDDLVHSGKVRYLGSSNFSGWQLAEAHQTARFLGLNPMVAAQNQYSLLERSAETEVLPACRHFGIGQIPWLTLAGGLLSGKYHRGDRGPAGSRLSEDPGPGHPATRLNSQTKALNDENFDIIENLESFAADRGISLLHVALGGLAAQPGISSVIARARTPEQVRANAEAALWEPTADDLVAISTITTRRVPA